MNERKERIMLICRIVFTVLLATCLGCGSKAIGPKPESDGVTPRTGSLVKTEKASEAEEKFAELSRRLETASEINKAEMKRTAERSDVVRQEVKGAYDEAFNGLDKKLKASEKASEDLIRDLDVSMARNNARLRELNEKMGELSLIHI